MSLRLTLPAPPRRALSLWRFAAPRLAALALLASAGPLLRRHEETLRLLAQWAPGLLHGFLLNIAMSLVAIVLATVGGAALGMAQCAPQRGRAGAARSVTLALRNAPWLVAVFYVSYLVPFEVELAGGFLFVPDWLKAAVGIALPAAGYMSEIVRGGIRAIPLQQWEAASALGLSRRQILARVVLPQALRGMVPPWMSLYCIVTLSTSLANLLGVEELMTSVSLRLAGETRPDLLLPAHAFTCIMFFLYIYPISLLARRLEQRWSLKQ